MLKTIKIVVDLDNTLLDATTPHLKYYNQVSGLHFTNDDVNDFYLYRLYNWERERKDIHYKQYGEIIHWESTPYPNAVEIVNQLSRKHQMTIMTARPLRFREITLKWLEKYEVECQNVMFTEHKYKEFMRLGADVLIDDGPHYAEEFSRNNQHVVLFDQPYNRQIGGEYIYRAKNWLEVSLHINNLDQIILK